MKAQNLMSLIFLAILTVQWTDVTADCEACLNGECFKKIIVLERYKQIGQLAMDVNKNIFYFQVRDNVQSNLNLAFDLDSVILHEISDVANSFARTVDQSTGNLYFSDYGNVYKTNPEDDFDFDVQHLFNASVWHMQYKDKLYYSLFNTNGMKYYESGTHYDINELSGYDIDDFVIDKNNDIYFQSGFSLYKFKQGENQAKLISSEIYALTTDNTGNAYFLQPYLRALHKINENNELVAIGAIKNGVPLKAVFTKQNYIIYSDSKLQGIYMLIPTSGTCIIASEGAGRFEKKTVALTEDN